MHVNTLVNCFEQRDTNESLFLLLLSTFEQYAAFYHSLFHKFYIAIYNWICPLPLSFRSLFSPQPTDSLHVSIFMQLTFPYALSSVLWHLSSSKEE